MASRLTLTRLGAVHSALAESVRDHAAPVFKLVVGIDADVRFRHAGREGKARAVWVPPGVTQAMGSEGVTVAFLAEPGAWQTPWRSDACVPVVLDARATDAATSIARASLRGRASDDPAALDAVFGRLALEGSRRCDRRVERALERLSASASIGAVASSVGLSPERLRHLARRELGVSLATWRLWQRTQRATADVVGGRAVARAAVDAGFSDHAHFTRSFVRFLGRTPSSMHGELSVQG
ncbi:MAG: helix-turn-helix transcriptional regulator [Sandaracinus sp.]|nr:helix-turn-helix transcriptional regulator [Sandaracinus sp.]MCB9622934.1 helix-turn-helix transcriptional regulator [Sandaracinus sp.]